LEEFRRFFIKRQPLGNKIIPQVPIYLYTAEILTEKKKEKKGSIKWHCVPTKILTG
jgi:hypothetical protein